MGLFLSQKDVRRYLEHAINHCETPSPSPLLALCPTSGGTPISGPHKWGYRVPGPAQERPNPGSAHFYPRSLSL
jgi:hypothetical protein